jgi:hypothetical protein
MSLLEVHSRRPLGRRASAMAGIAVAAGLVLWAVLYATGVWPWFGFEAWTRRSVAVGPGQLIIGEDRAGGSTGFGFSTFVFFKGQTIVVSYDVTIRRGCLWMQVWHLGDHGPNESVSQCVAASGEGEWTVPVGATGFYAIIIDASVTKGPGPGYDMDYTVWWGARW